MSLCVVACGMILQVFVCFCGFGLLLLAFAHFCLLLLTVVVACSLVLLLLFARGNVACSLCVTLARWFLFYFFSDCITAYIMSGVALTFL